MTTYTFGPKNNPCYDTFVWASEPSKPHDGLGYAIIGNGTANYQWGAGFGSIPKGSTINSARLTVYSAGDWGGSSALTCYGAADPWDASKSTWNNRPGLGGTGINVTHVVGQPGVAFTFDVADKLQNQLDQGNPTGFVIRFTDGGGERRIFSKHTSSQHFPVLVVEATKPGDKPANLKPNGYVAVPKPWLIGFPKTTTHLQIEADPEETGFGSPTWNSDDQTVVAPEFNLADSTFPGTLPDDTWYWRAHWHDDSGDWSDWSDPIPFTYEPLPDFTITNPSADNPFVTDSSPRFTRTTPDDPTVVTKERLYVTLVDDPTGTRLWEAVYEAAEIDNSHTMPNGILKDLRQYRVWWELFDQYDRVSLPGGLPYAREAQVFTMQPVTGVPPVTVLRVEQIEYSPLVRLHWERDAGTPDQFTMWRDNEILLDHMDPADFYDDQEDGWAYVDGSAAPQRQHVYYLQAITNGNASVFSPRATITTKVGGDWLVDAPNNLSVFMSEATSTTFETQDQVIVVWPSGSQRPVVFHQQLGWRRGTIQGLLATLPGMRTRDEYEDDWEAMRQITPTICQWARGNTMFGVVLWNMQTQPGSVPQTTIVTCNYAQITKDRAEGDLPGPEDPTIPAPDRIYRYADIGLDDGDALTVGMADITSTTGSPVGSDDAIWPTHFDTEGWV